MEKFAVVGDFVQMKRIQHALSFKTISPSVISRHSKAGEFRFW
jgi:hypothetical protein